MLLVLTVMSGVPVKPKYVGTPASFVFAESGKAVVSSSPGASPSVPRCSSFDFSAVAISLVMGR